MLNRDGVLLEFGRRIKLRMKSDFQVLLEQAKAEMENIRREEERQKAEKERRDLQAENKMQDRDRSGFLRQYRTNELVRWRMHFLSDAIAEIEGLLKVNRDFCKKQMAEKASPALPTNCAVVP